MLVSAMIYLYIILALNFLWLSILTFTLFRILIHYKKLTRGDKNENLIGIWEKYLEKEKQNEISLEDLHGQLSKLGEKSVYPIQKVGVVRFNPFNEDGGNQSFAVSLLDENGNGMLLSSLHGRGLTRVYAKPVKGFGPEDFEFSKEEQDAVLIAKNTKH